MKRFLTALVYVAALGLALPVFAGLQVVIRDCGPYHYEIQPVLNGTIFRVRDGQRIRELFYNSRQMTVHPGCQGNKVAVSEGFSSKYYQWTDISVVNPEGPTLLLEKGFTGTSGYNAAGVPTSRVMTINGITQLTGVFLALYPPSSSNPQIAPPTVEITFLKNGITKRQLPHVTNPNVLPWPNTTSTLIYTAEYLFDGQDVFVHERMGERNVSNGPYAGWMDRWSKLMPDSTYAPTSDPQLNDQILPSDSLGEPLAQILNKARLTNQSDTLNDRSYYVFGSNGSIIKKLASRSWDTTFGERELKCGNATYTLYRKQFAEKNTATSTYPYFQYIVERTEGINRLLIPIPHVDQSWKLRGIGDGQSWEPGERSLWYASLEACAGQNATLHIAYEGHVTNSLGQTNTGGFTRGVLVTANTRFIDYFSSSKSIGETKDDPYKVLTSSPQGITISGKLEKKGMLVTGDATLTELTANGSVVRTKPPYFRDIRSYPSGTRMTFSRHPVTGQFTIELAAPERDYPNQDGSYDFTTRWTYELYVQENGAYRLIPEKSYAYQLFPPKTDRMTPIFVSKERDFLAFRSYFLARVTLLHGLSGKLYSLDWYRIGALTRDGSFKVWYAITVDGKQQTWSATIR